MRFSDFDFPLTETVIDSAAGDAAVKLATGNNAHFGCDIAASIDTTAVLNALTATVDTTDVAAAQNTLSANNVILGSDDNDGDVDATYPLDNDTDVPVSDSTFTNKSFNTDDVSAWTTFTADDEIKGTSWIAGDATVSGLYAAASFSETLNANRAMSIGEQGKVNWGAIPNMEMAA